MNNLKRNKRPFYYCTRQEENGRIFYSKPKRIRLNYQPISSEGEMIAIGPEYYNRLIVYMRPNYGKLFHHGDRCYVFVEPPKTYDKTCNTADYFVDGEPKIYINEYTMHLTRMKGDDYGDWCKHWIR